MDQPRQVTSDVDIIVALQTDPADGLRFLIETHGGEVRGYLKRHFRTLDHLQIEAALNTALHQMWKFAPRYDESKGTVCGCYLSFARNAAASIVRGEHRQNRLRTDYETILGKRMPGGDACDDAPPPGPQREKLLAALRAAVRELPNMQRQIVEADLEGDGQAGGQWLADKLGTHLNSIYVNRCRAIKNLRIKMAAAGFYRD